MCAAKESWRDPGNVYSYMSASAVAQSLIHQLEIGAGESLTGIYFNDSDHFVAFTDKAFYWVRKEREVICRYSSILRTKLPDDAQDVSDERAIEVVLKNGDFIFLPVFNDSDGVEDIYFISRMLNRLITASINIQSLEDMIARLNAAYEDYKLNPASWRTPMPTQYFESVIAYLYTCLDQCSKGEPILNLSPEQNLRIDQPQTWQLIAEVLLAPKTFDPATKKHQTEGDGED